MAARTAQAVPRQGTVLSILRGAARSRPPSRAFLGRPSTEVAPDLLGMHLVRETPRGRLVARLVEVEAYEEGDPASHSYRGRTERTAVMFGPAGHLYVYFTYGMHFCVNVVTGKEGEGSAVLLRAAEPLEGLEDMSRRRGTGDPRLLCSGPARLTQAFGLGMAENGADLLAGDELRLVRGRRVPPDRIAAGPRVGIRVAREVPWRFAESGSPFLSRPAGPRRVLSGSTRDRSAAGA